MAGIIGLQSSSLQVAANVVNDTAVAAVEEKVVPEASIVDEVVWVVGDEPILKSDIEMMRMQGMVEAISVSVTSIESIAA